MVGQTVQVIVDEATSFTLFGTLVTGEQIGAPHTEEDSLAVAERPPVVNRRVGLPLL